MLNLFEGLTDSGVARQTVVIPRNVTVKVAPRSQIARKHILLAHYAAAYGDIGKAHCGCEKKDSSLCAKEKRLPITACQCNCHKAKYKKLKGKRK